MSKQLSNTNKLTVKDLVTTGIFTALFTVIMLIGGVFFATNPVLTFLMPLGSALLPGPVYLLLSAKVPKKGAITILGTLVGIFMFITGMHWSMAVGFIVLGIIADVISATGKYKNFKLTITGYALLMLSNTTSYIMFFLDQKNYLAYMLKNSTADPAYFDTMVKTGQSWMLPAIILGTIICAVIGGLIGKKLLRKQFRKAGIVA
ncbi:MptD family putative ECF transporter S component [Clostridium oceanicum]|uniref:MptD family putative ECF transporter S component n=1 Tax=Clostridium oceanicum TaxID=1543 RepID=A0ABP3UK63_9CLOT